MRIKNFGASSRATLSVLRPFPISFGYLHFRTFCGRAATDAPECIYRQRRCTGRQHRTCRGGSRGSASLPGKEIAFRHTYDN